MKLVRIQWWTRRVVVFFASFFLITVGWTVARAPGRGPREELAEAASHRGFTAPADADPRAVRFLLARRAG